MNGPDFPTGQFGEFWTNGRQYICGGRQNQRAKFGLNTQFTQQFADRLDLMKGRSRLLEMTLRAPTKRA